MNYLLTDEETERLTFRPLVEDDFDTWLPFFKDPIVAKYLAFDTSLNQQQLCEFWFEKALERYKNNTGGMNVLIDKQNGNFIGQSGLLIQDIEGEEVLEIGYSLLPQHRGKGFAFEAANKCKTFAFENNLAPALVSVIHVENDASKKVAIKNGMSYKKTIDDFHNIQCDVFEVKQKSH